MTSNIYQLHKQLFMIVPHYVIFIVHIQLRDHIKHSTYELSISYVYWYCKLYAMTTS